MGDLPFHIAIGMSCLSDDIGMHVPVMDNIAPLSNPSKTTVDGRNIAKKMRSLALAMNLDDETVQLPLPPKFNVVGRTHTLA